MHTTDEELEFVAFSSTTQQIFNISSKQHKATVRIRSVKSLTGSAQQRFKTKPRATKYTYQVYVLL